MRTRDQRVCVADLLFVIPPVGRRAVAVRCPSGSGLGRICYAKLGSLPAPMINGKQDVDGILAKDGSDSRPRMILYSASRIAAGGRRRDGSGAGSSRSGAAGGGPGGG